jgi:pimeloyl-ACP methyl ester carboxylesterase
MTARDLVDGHFIYIEGLKTFYIKSGGGYPLVLIHGGSPGACASVSWRKNIEPLAGAGFLVYAFDQPGFGLTDNPTDYSMEFRVRHAKSYIDTLGLQNYYLIGNSHGGYIAARLAIGNPRVKGLVLVSTSGAPVAPSHLQAGRQHLAELKQYTPSLENARSLTMGTLFHKSLVDEISQERYEMSVGKNLDAQSARSQMGSPEPFSEEELKNIKAKTLIIWGNNDRGSPAERALLLFKIMSGAELHVFDSCRHWPQWDQTLRFNQIVGGFLQSVSSENSPG